MKNKKMLIPIAYLFTLTIPTITTTAMKISPYTINNRKQSLNETNNSNTNNKYSLYENSDDNISIHNYIRKDENYPLSNNINKTYIDPIFFKKKFFTEINHYNKQKHINKIENLIYKNINYNKTNTYNIEKRYMPTYNTHMSPTISTKNNSNTQSTEIDQNLNGKKNTKIIEIKINENEKDHIDLIKDLPKKEANLDKKYKTQSYGYHAQNLNNLNNNQNLNNKIKKGFYHYDVLKRWTEKENGKEINCYLDQYKKIHRIIDGIDFFIRKDGCFSFINIQDGIERFFTKEGVLHTITPEGKECYEKNGISYIKYHKQDYCIIMHEDYIDSNENKKYSICNRIKKKGDKEIHCTPKILKDNNYDNQIQEYSNRLNTILSEEENQSLNNKEEKYRHNKNNNIYKKKILEKNNNICKKKILENKKIKKRPHTVYSNISKKQKQYTQKQYIQNKKHHIKDSCKINQTEKSQYKICDLGHTSIEEKIITYDKINKKILNNIIMFENSEKPKKTSYENDQKPKKNIDNLYEKFFQSNKELETEENIIENDNSEYSESQEYTIPNKPIKTKSHIPYFEFEDTQMIINDTKNNRNAKTT